MAADNLSEFLNGQEDGTVSEIIPGPVLSFLTAASSLEQEEPECYHQYFSVYAHFLM